MIQLEVQWDLASRLSLPSEQIRTERRCQSEEIGRVEAPAAPSAASASEDEIAFVSPPPAPFPRVFPGL
jgi:hypothetical protein